MMPVTHWDVGRSRDPFMEVLEAEAMGEGFYVVTNLLTLLKGV